MTYGSFLTIMKLKGAIMLFSKKKEYETKTVEEEHEIDLGEVRVHLSLNDGSLHELVYQGSYKTSVVDNKLQIEVTHANAKAQNFIEQLGQLPEEAFFRVSDNALPNVTFKRRSQLKSFVMMKKDVKENKKFSYKIQIEKTEK